MLVYGPGANAAAAWKVDLRLVETAKKRAHEITRAAHFTYAVLVGNPRIYTAGIYFDNLPLALAVRAERSEYVKHYFDIGDVWNVFQNADIVRKNRSSHDSHRGVFAAADEYLSVERLSAVDDKSFHKNPYALLLK